MSNIHDNLFPKGTIIKGCFMILPQHSKVPPVSARECDRENPGEMFSHKSVVRTFENMMSFQRKSSQCQIDDSANITPFNFG